MPRTIEHEPLSRHVILLYQGDFAKLGQYFPTLTATTAARRIIRKYLEGIDAAGPQTEIKEKLDV